jgi:hypothetical protein
MRHLWRAVIDANSLANLECDTAPLSVHISFSSFSHRLQQSPNTLNPTHVALHTRQSSATVSDPLNPAMSKRTAKAHASSAKAASAFGSTFGSSAAAFGVASSQLSYVTEPPDLSGISDAGVKVLFKNLSKRDSTTKAKALEDIQAHISREPAEEGLLEAWVRVTSICTYCSFSNRSCLGQNLPPNVH